MAGELLCRRRDRRSGEGEPSERCLAVADGVRCAVREREVTWSVSAVLDPPLHGSSRSASGRTGPTVN